MNTLAQVFIGKEVAYAAKTGGGTIAGHQELNLLALGAVAIFTESNVLVTTATTPASISNIKQFYIALSTPKGIKTSILVDRSAFNRAYCAYVAPVKNVWCVGQSTVLGAGASNLPASPIAGTIAELGVGVGFPLEEHANMPSRSEYVVRTGDTPLAILTALVAKINAENPYATAALDPSNAGILLTAREFGHVLNITTNGILQYATVAQQVAINFGKGTAAQVKELEADARINDGDQSRVHRSDKYFNVAYLTDDTETYDMWQIQWKTEHRNAVASQTVAIPTLTLALPNGAAVVTSVNTIMNDIILVDIPDANAGASFSLT